MKQYHQCKLDSLDQLVPFPSDGVRWLDMPGDFPLIERYYNTAFSTSIEMSDFPTNQWRCCAMIENDEIVSFAGVLYMTAENWEIGAVSTHPLYRNRGYAKKVCSVVAQYILENGKQATCATKLENLAMQRVMRDIGMVMQ